jgi:hypothetical protein
MLRMKQAPAPGASTTVIRPASTREVSATIVRPRPGPSPESLPTSASLFERFWRTPWLTAPMARR